MNLFLQTVVGELLFLNSSCGMRQFGENIASSVASFPAQRKTTISHPLAGVLVVSA